MTSLIPRLCSAWSSTRCKLALFFQCPRGTAARRCPIVANPLLILSCIKVLLSSVATLHVLNILFVEERAGERREEGEVLQKEVVAPRPLPFIFCSLSLFLGTRRKKGRKGKGMLRKRSWSYTFRFGSNALLDHPSSAEALDGYPSRSVLLLSRQRKRNYCSAGSAAAQSVVYSLINNKTVMMGRKRLPFGWWKRIENQRAFMSELGQSLGVTQVLLYMYFLLYSVSLLSVVFTLFFVSVPNVWWNYE